MIAAEEDADAETASAPNTAAPSSKCLTLKRDIFSETLMLYNPMITITASQHR